MSIFKREQKQEENVKQKSSALSMQSISSYLNNEVKIHCYDTIDSTNNEAKRYADLNSDTPALFVADHQSSGRGRLGRSFYSPTETGIYMSLLLKPQSSIDNIVCMTTAAAVCVTDALIELCKIKPEIKWVNDIYLNNKKICGILCEAVTNPSTNKIDSIIIGVGINVSTTDFPSELKDIAGAIGKDLNRNRLCALITDNIIDACENIADRSFIGKYKERSMVLGREITYTENGEAKTATAIDIDENGGLVIKTEEEIKTLSTGEISVRVK